MGWAGGWASLNFNFILSCFFKRFLIMPFKKFVSKCFFASLLQKKVEKNSGDFLLSENLSGNGCDGHERGWGGHRGPGVPLFPLSFLSFKSQGRSLPIGRDMMTGAANQIKILESRWKIFMNVRCQFYVFANLLFNSKIVICIYEFLRWVRYSLW